MTVLEEVIQMKDEGISDEEIIQKLQERGVAPKEITNAISKAQIKSAVSGSGIDEMQPSIMPAEETTNPRKIQEMGTQQNAYEESPEDYQQNYGYEGTYYEESETDSLIEIAEQVFSEKIRKTQKIIDELNEFKTISEAKIEDFSERLRRMESMIDKLQIAILERIGSYGKNIEAIKGEMSMMQDSFGKMLNPFLDSTEKKKSKKVKE